MNGIQKQDVLKRLYEAFVRFHLEEVRGEVRRALDLRVDPMDIVNIMKEGLDEVGRLYERGEYFLTELMMAGNMATEIMDVLKPHLRSAGKESAKGKVLIGTVQGDVHDIGKNLVITMLSSAGFEVIDLGVDVPAEKFLEAIKTDSPDILAMSCLLTTGMDQMKIVIDKLVKAKLRGKVRILVGGRPISQIFAQDIGADAYGKDAIEAVKIAINLLKDR